MIEAQRDHRYRNEDLVVLLQDGYRLLMFHQSGISQSALQVYDSALPFVPKSALLYQTYQHEAKGAVRVLHGVSSQWSPCLTSIYGGHGLKSLAYSTNGHYYATGHWHGAIQVRDAGSCALLMNMEHSGDVLSVTFMPDHVSLLSGSSDGTMFLWDVVTGINIRSFLGHEGPVHAICVSA